MNGTKRIKILAVIFILLSVAAWFSLQKKFSSDTITKEEDEISIADTASISKIIIRKDGQIQTLTKNEKAEWLINNKYEVRNNVMNLLLMGLNQLEIKRPVSEELKSKANEFLKKKGTKLTVEYGDKTKTLFFASNENDINTTYLLIENSEVPYIAYVPGVPGDINNIFKLQEHEWRSRELFTSNPGEIQNLKVSYLSEPQSNFEIYFQGGNLFVKDVNGLDTTRLYEYLELYRYVPLSGYINAKADSVEMLFKKVQPYATINLTDISAERSNSILIYKGSDTKKDYLARLEKTNEPVTVNKEFFDRLLVKKSHFIKK